MAANGAAASYGDLLVTSLIVLGAVCVAAVVLVRLAGRFLATGRVRGAHLLDVIARVPLEPRRSLYVVEVAGKTLLVGTSEMGLSVLSELDGDEVRARAADRPSFGDLVREAWGRRRGLRRAAASGGASDVAGGAASGGAASGGAAGGGAAGGGAAGGAGAGAASGARPEAAAGAASSAERGAVERAGAGGASSEGA